MTRALRTALALGILGSLALAPVYLGIHLAIWIMR